MRALQYSELDSSGLAMQEMIVVPAEVLVMIKSIYIHTETHMLLLIFYYWHLGTCMLALLRVGIVAGWSYYSRCKGWHHSFLINISFDSDFFPLIFRICSRWRSWWWYVIAIFFLSNSRYHMPCRYLSILSIVFFYFISKFYINSILYSKSKRKNS